MKRTVCRWFFVAVFFCFNATPSHALVGDIQLLNRWPVAGPNSVALANIGGIDYVFVGDGEIISVYEYSTTLNLLHRTAIDLSEEADLDKAGEVAGTEGIYGLFYADNHLYVACGNEGLQIFDVSDPLNIGPPLSVYIPKETLGRATASDVAVRGNYVYLVYFLLTSEGYDSGIQVINVTDKTAPALMGECNLPETFADIKRAQGIHVAEVPAGSGDYYAFVADLYNGLVIFDINNPAKPKADAACYFTYAYDVAVAEVPAGSGKYYAYVADDFAGLRIISFDPAEFTDEVDILYGDAGDTIPTCQYASSYSKALSVTVDPANALAVVGDRDFGLVVIDVSNVNNINTISGGVDPSPYVKSYATDLAGAYSVCLDTGGANPVVYVADTVKGLQVVSLVDPMDTATWEAAGVEDTSTPADADAVFIDAETSYIYVVDDDAANNGNDEGLKIFYTIISEEYISFLLKGTLPTDGEARDVYFSAGYVYVADGSKGLKIVDPGLPEDGADADTARDNQFLAHPVLKGSCVVAGGTGDAKGVFVSGNYAYVAAGTGGLSIINVSDKAAPKEKAVLNGADILDARAVLVTGDYAYVADGANGLKIVDVSVKTAPVLIKAVALDGIAQDLYELRGRVYVAGGSAGFHVVVVSDPEAARRVSGYAAAPYDDVKGIYAAISDESPAVDLLWVSSGKGGMGFFTYPPDVPPQPVVNFNSFGDAKAVAVFGDFAFIADGGGGLLATTVSTAAGDPTDEGWDWLADITATDLHATSYSSSSGCAVETILPYSEKVMGFLTGLFKK